MQHAVDLIDTKEFMINLMGITLKPAAIAILSKGLNIS
jgi:hypothetical protein